MLEIGYWKMDLGILLVDQLFFEFGNGNAQCAAHFPPYLGKVF